MSHANIPDGFLFPPPSGEFAIGTRTFHWVDSNSPEPFTPEIRPNRELIVQFWYPTRLNPALADNTGRNSLYSSPSFSSLVGLLEAKTSPKVTLNHLLRLKTYTEMNAPILIPVEAGSTAYPVIIFNHGLDLDKESATSSCEELASHGFVVISADHPSFSKKSILPSKQGDAVVEFNSRKFLFEYKNQRDTYLSDVNFILDTVTGIRRHSADGFFESDLYSLLDTTRIGIFGHSYGGGTAIELLNQNSKIKAAVSLDGLYQKNGLHFGWEGYKNKPTLLLITETNAAKLKLPASDWIETKEGQAISRSNTDLQLKLLTFEKARHHAFIDRVWLQKWLLEQVEIKDLDRILDVGSLDAFEFSRQINSSLTNFFKEHLDVSGDRTADQ